MNKRHIILIGGDLAAGKSTFSHFLQERYNITLINKDRLKEICGDTILAKNREENKLLSIVSFDMIKYIINSTPFDIIIESNFKDYEMEELKVLLKDQNVLSLVLTGNNELLHKRFIKRLDDNRHYVHKSQDFSNISDFILCLEDLRKVQYIGEVIKVNIDNCYPSENKDLIIKIDEFMKK